VTGSVGDSNEIQNNIKKEDWNDYVIIAKGSHLQHFINGRQTIDVNPDEREGGKGAKSGILALQLHAGDPMTVQFKKHPDQGTEIAPAGVRFTLRRQGRLNDLPRLFSIMKASTLSSPVFLVGLSALPGTQPLTRKSSLLPAGPSHGPWRP